MRGNAFHLLASPPKLLVFQQYSVRNVLMSNDFSNYIHEVDPSTLTSIHHWINDTLSENHQQFNNLPACPYAKEALIKSEVLILSASTQIPTSVQSILQGFDSFKKRVIVLTCPKDSLTVEETEELVKGLRTEFASKNLWLMYDHPQVEETVDNIDFSYGKALLFFFQKLDDISEAAEKLLDKGYYKNWPKDYFHEVYSGRDRLNKKNKFKTYEK